MKDFDKLFSLVKMMRNAQKEWFKFHNSGALTESKRLECEVDKYIIECEREDAGQLTLFGKEVTNE